METPDAAKALFYTASGVIQRTFSKSCRNYRDVAATSSRAIQFSLSRTAVKNAFQLT